MLHVSLLKTTTSFRALEKARTKKFCEKRFGNMVVQVWRVSALATKRAKSSNNKKERGVETMYIEVQPDASDVWRIDPVIDMLRNGQVGIIPTDSNPAFVCDPNNKAAVELLYRLKGAHASKRLSLLCRDFKDISNYTLGFPTLEPGEPDLFRLIKSNSILPGPYTFIMQASKQVPKQITNFDTGKSKRRSTVGIRVPDNDICQYLLNQLDGPLLCSSAFSPGTNDSNGSLDSEGQTFDSALLADTYGRQGLGFVIAIEGSYDADPSTVIDFSGARPELIREGKGETSWLPT